MPVGIYERTLEMKKNMSEAQLKRFNNPRGREKHRKALNRPEVRMKRKEIMNNPEIQAKIKATKEKNGTTARSLMVRAKEKATKIRNGTIPGNPEITAKMLATKERNGTGSGSPAVQAKMKATRKRNNTNLSNPIIQAKRQATMEKNKTTLKNPIIQARRQETMRKNKTDKRSPESIKRYKLAAQKRCREDTKYWENLHKSLHLKPNKPEIQLNKILQKFFPNEYKYVGDFSFILGGKNPDFMNINGKKKLIELYGDYWHRNDDPQDRIDFFKQFGFDTLVIWENELEDKKSLSVKLEKFQLKKYFN